MKLTMTFLMSFLIISSLPASTTLIGNVVDSKTGENLIGANISVFKNNLFSTGTSTDIDGEYKLGLDPGTYDVEITYMGYEAHRMEDVIVRVGKDNELMVGLDPGITLKEIVITEYKVPIIQNCCWTCCGNRCLASDKAEGKEEEKVDIDLTINYYPNPTTDVLHIDLGQATKSLVIRSMDGKELLRRSNLQSEMVDLNVSEYAAGTYILQAGGEGFLISKKFIVLRE